ncbi:hypothetical protein K443DRAFT_105198, partial [Laccaria amethystina LaAM-08-1]
SFQRIRVTLLPDYIAMMAHFGEAVFCAPLSETTPVVVEGSDGAEILSVNCARRLSFIEVFDIRWRRYC